METKPDEDNCSLKEENNNEDAEQQKVLEKQTLPEEQLMEDIKKDQSNASGQILKEVRRHLEEGDDLDRSGPPPEGGEDQGGEGGYMQHSYNKMRQDFYDVCDTQNDRDEKQRALEETIVMLQIQNTKADANYTRLQNMYDEMSAKTVDYEKTIGKLSEENSALKRNNSVTSQSDEVVVYDDVYDKEILDLKIKVQGMKKEVDKMRNLKEDTEERFSDLRETIKDRESKLNQAKEQIKAKEDAVGRGIEELKKQKHDFLKSKEESEIASNTLRETIKDLECKLDQAHGKIKEKEADVSTMSKDYEDLKANYDDACVANKKGEERLKGTLYEVHTSKEQIELLTVQLKEKEVFASDLAQSYESFKNETKEQLQTLQKECDVLQSQVKAKDVQIIDVATAYNEFRKKSAEDSASESDLRKNLEDEMAVFREQNEVIQSKLKESDGCIAMEKEELEQLKSDYDVICKENRGLVIKRLNYKEKKHLLVQELEDLKDERDKRLEEHQVSMELYNQLREEYYQMCAENGDLEHKLKSHADENSYLKERVEIVRLGPKLDME